MDNHDCHIALSVYISLSIGFVFGICFTKIQSCYLPKAETLGPAPIVREWLSK